MKFLLDTHTLLWRHTLPDRLPLAVRQALAAPQNDVAVSVVSAWELTIKAGLGKLALPSAPTALFRAAVAASGYRVVGVDVAHIELLEGLPLHHRDPFDRLLVAQCLWEQAAFVTADNHLSAYPIEVFWETQPGAPLSRSP